MIKLTCLSKGFTKLPERFTMFSMKNFHDYYFGLSQQERKLFVEKADTTIGYAERVASGYRLPSVPMCYRLIRASNGGTNVAAIVETYEKRNGPI